MSTQNDPDKRMAEEMNASEQEFRADLRAKEQESKAGLNQYVQAARDEDMSKSKDDAEAEKESRERAKNFDKDTYFSNPLFNGAEFAPEESNAAEKTQDAAVLQVTSKKRGALTNEDDQHWEVLTKLQEEAAKKKDEAARMARGEEASVFGEGGIHSVTIMGNGPRAGHVLTPEEMKADGFIRNQDTGLYYESEERKATHYAQISRVEMNGHTLTPEEMTAHGYLQDKETGLYVTKDMLGKDGTIEGNPLHDKYAEMMKKAGMTDQDRRIATGGDEIPNGTEVASNVQNNAARSTGNEGRIA